MSNTQPPPAGWYDDGQTSGQERYWDGTRWTDAFRPITVETAHVAPRRKLSNGAAVGIGIGGTVIIVAILVAVVTSYHPPRPTAAATATHTATSEPSAAETEPAPEPSTDAGTLSNPYPAGTTLDVAGTVDAQLSFTGLNIAANDAVTAANQFNDVPAAGMQWAVLTVNVKNTGTSPIRPGDLVYSINLASTDGQVYGQKFATLDNLLSSAPDAAPGASVAGDIAYQVPVGTSGVLINAGESFVRGQ